MEEILKRYKKRVKLENFEQLVDYSTTDSRELLIADVTEDVADQIDLFIRFFNRIDETNETPINERKPIKIFINSGGGSVMGAFTIIDAIELSKTPVYTIVHGTAYSAGLEIAAAGHKRFCYPNASFLFHEGSISLGSVDANKFKNYADFYRKLLEKSRSYLLKNTKITEGWYEQHQNDDYWMFADEAIELGFCDAVITELS